MFWLVYIARKGKLKADKHRLFIKGTSVGDTRAAIIFAAKRFDVSPDLVLCLPTSQKEMN